VASLCLTETGNDFGPEIEPIVATELSDQLSPASNTLLKMTGLSKLRNINFGQINSFIFVFSFLFPLFQFRYYFPILALANFFCLII